MPRARKKIFENLSVLVLLGLLAGALGGLGIGLIQVKSVTSSASSTK
jgi:hypothetical protein